MAYQILNTVTGKTLKDAIARKAIQFDTAEGAQSFADSHRLNYFQAAAYRPNAPRRFQLRVVAA